VSQTSQHVNISADAGIYTGTYTGRFDYLIPSEAGDPLIHPRTHWHTRPLRLVPHPPHNRAPNSQPGRRGLPIAIFCNKFPPCFRMNNPMLNRLPHCAG
jgi:hypothetical protein